MNLTASGYGDVSQIGQLAFGGGGGNSTGDEGCRGHRIEMYGEFSPIKRHILMIPPQTACATTLARDISPTTAPQVVQVAATSGCAVNDRVGAVLRRAQLYQRRRVGADCGGGRRTMPGSRVHAHF